MWKWVIGPALAILPARWRAMWFPVAPQAWPTSVLVSGAMETVGCAVAMVLWYLWKMTGEVRSQLDVTIEATQGVPGELAAYGMGVAAFFLFAAHPLTWVLAYFAVEGVFRGFAAAVNEEQPGTLPLALLDRLYLRIRRARRGEPEPDAYLYEPGEPRGFVRVTAGAAKERLRLLRLPLVPDEVAESADAGETWLDIRSCRPKPAWKPPQLVRYDGRFYRLESCGTADPPRPYRFRLRRLPAGVPGRRVVDYFPDDPLFSK